MTRLKMKLKNQSRKPLKGKRRQKMLPRKEVQLLQKPTEYTGRKTAETTIPKSGKKPQDSSTITKSTEEKINNDPKAPKGLQSLAAG